MLEVPLTPSTPRYRQEVTIAGTPYLFDVRWNSRAEVWFLDLLQIDETPIRQGIAMVLGTWLGLRTARTSVDFPPGLIYMQDLSGENRDATFDDLGTRVRMYIADYV